MFPTHLHSQLHHSPCVWINLSPKPSFIARLPQRGVIRGPSVFPILRYKSKTCQSNLVIRASHEDTSAAVVRNRKHEWWSEATENMTLMSTFTGLFLMAPQIAKNHQQLLVDPTSLSIISWVGYSTGFLGNMLLMAYFSSKGEASATTVQIVGATSTAVVLSQVYLASHMPHLAFVSVVAFLILGVLVNSVKLWFSMPESLWNAWEDVNGIIGLAVLAQVLCQTIVPTQQSLLPGILSAAAALVLAALRKAGKLPGVWEKTWVELSGWTATLLFMLMPVAQLKECFTRPSSLAGLSTLGPIMGIISNGLMIPRALFIRDIIWLTGCTWGTLMMGWGVLMTMAYHRVVSRRVVVLVTALLALYFMFVGMQDREAHSI